MRQHHFAGTHFKPRKMPENAQTPTSRVHAVLGSLLLASSFVLPYKGTNESKMIRWEHIWAHITDGLSSHQLNCLARQPGCFECRSIRSNRTCLCLPVCSNRIVLTFVSSVKPGSVACRRDHTS